MGERQVILESSSEQVIISSTDSGKYVSMAVPFLCKRFFLCNLN